MPPDAQVTTIAHVIQQAVAPVFLIAGIGSMLGVLTNRFGRIVDRARRLEEQLADTQVPLPAHTEHLDVLGRRARLIHWAIGFCAICALLICTVVMILFVGALLDLNFASGVALLFIMAMSSFILGLLCFLREIHLAISHLRIGPVR
ncbi:MAG: DUF2721 domain-containing protein [Nevskiaceae bacterium]|nr:MAG: DUF2721 domain-containing protein [Nevskiaceae bacterium]